MYLPKITIRRSKVSEAGEVLEQAEMDLPQGKAMDEYQKIRGDGSARVSVGTDMSSKDYGTGAGAMVSVTLSCNQDKDSIERAIELAGSLARAYCTEQRQLAEAEFQKEMQARMTGGAPFLTSGGPHG